MIGTTLVFMWMLAHQPPQASLAWSGPSQDSSCVPDTTHRTVVRSVYALDVEHMDGGILETVKRFLVSIVWREPDTLTIEETIGTAPDGSRTFLVRLVTDANDVWLSASSDSLVRSWTHLPFEPEQPFDTNAFRFVRKLWFFLRDPAAVTLTGHFLLGPTNVDARVNRDALDSSSRCRFTAILRDTDTREPNVSGSVEVVPNSGQTLYRTIEVWFHKQNILLRLSLARFSIEQK